MPTVILHQWEISPFCGKVRKVLHHKGIDFTVVNYNGLFAAKAKRLTRVGELPVLGFEDERVQTALQSLHTSNGACHSLLWFRQIQAIARSHACWRIGQTNCEETIALVLASSGRMTFIGCTAGIGAFRLEYRPTSVSGRLTLCGCL